MFNRKLMIVGLETLTLANAVDVTSISKEESRGRERACYCLHISVSRARIVLDIYKRSRVRLS